MRIWAPQYHPFSVCERKSNRSGKGIPKGRYPWSWIMPSAMMLAINPFEVPTFPNNTMQQFCCETMLTYDKLQWKLEDGAGVQQPICEYKHSLMVCDGIPVAIVGKVSRFGVFEAVLQICHSGTCYQTENDGRVIGNGCFCSRVPHI